MAKDQIIVGLDIGTCFVRVVVAKSRPEQSKLQIIGVGRAPSFGLRRGIVVDIEEAAKSISQAVSEAERASGVSIESALASVSGAHITSKISKGVVAVSRADSEVSHEDVKRAIDAVSAISISPNRQIIHVIPRGFSVDSHTDIKDPVGMSGVRLEVDALIVEAAMPFVKNLGKCIAEAGLEVEGFVLSPLAASYAALNKRQKELGVLALDLGGGTASMIVFEEGNIMYSSILPVGSAHITNDIAIGLRSDIDLAEKIKLEYGTALVSEIGKKDMVDLVKLGFSESVVVDTKAKVRQVDKLLVPRTHIAEIIEARLCEVFELVNKELKTIDRQGLLPAGVVLLGGGAKMPGLVDLAKDILNLPVQVGFPSEIEAIGEEIDDPSFATAIGLCLWGWEQRGKTRMKGIALPEFSFGGTIGRVKSWLRGFIP